MSCVAPDSISNYSGVEYLIKFFNFPKDAALRENGFEPVQNL